jgi:hypothetical protein
MNEKKDKDLTNLSILENTNLPQYVDITFETKNQLKLFVGERSRTVFDSGCKMFDLVLKEPFQVSLF